MAAYGEETQGHLGMCLPGILRVIGCVLEIFERRLEYLDLLENQAPLITLRCGHLLFHAGSSCSSPHYSHHTQILLEKERSKNKASLQFQA
jgi:hypothetical protein